MQTYYLVTGVLYDNAGRAITDVSGHRSVAVAVLTENSHLRKELEKRGHVQPEDQVLVLI